MVQTLKHDPQFEFNLLLEDTLGVSRDFNDEAFVLQNSQDEFASVDVAVVNKSMAGFSNLNLENAKKETLNANGLTLYEIGVKASKNALDYFKSQGIDIQKDYPHLYILTSAGYVNLNGKNTGRVLEGLLKGLGNGFDSKNLKTSDDLSWKDLTFYFIYSKTKTVYALKYDNGKSKSSTKARHLKVVLMSTELILPV